MRSSKSRSRSKSNRNNNNRSVGNVMNRVFDSSGPEGKVRGTPQQIIEKYQQLTRDAQLSGDRVAAENFQQHAEHYMRLLAVAQKEMDARREVQERENREKQAQRDQERAERQERQQNAPAAEPAVDPMVQSDDSEQPDIMPMADEAPVALVETPEAEAKPADAPKPKPRRRRPAKPAEPAPEASTDAAE